MYWGSIMSNNYLSKSYWNGMIKMSLTRLFILRALHETPMHGYALREKISDLTRGCCTPTEGALYPTLHEFERGGYVTCREQTVQGRTRKIYTLTNKGLQACRAGLEAWEETARSLLDARKTVSSPSPANEVSLADSQEVKPQ